MFRLFRFVPGRRNAKPSAPQALLSFVPLVSSSRKIKIKRRGSGGRPCLRIRAYVGASGTSGTCGTCGTAFIVRALARLTRTYRPQLKTQYEAFAAQDELRYTGFTPQ